jgi:hypothetical protein
VVTVVTEAITAVISPGREQVQITRRGLGEGRGARCRDDLGQALLSVPPFRPGRPGSPSFDVVGAIGHQPPPPPLDRVRGGSRTALLRADTTAVAASVLAPTYMPALRAASAAWGPAYVLTPPTTTSQAHRRHSERTRLRRPLVAPRRYKPIT